MALKLDTAVLFASPTATACVSVVCVLFALGIQRWLRDKRMLSKMPPGPPGLPIIGNALQVGQRPWLLYQKLGRKYGPLVTLNMSGTPLVVITRQAEAKQLLEQKGNNTSSRPALIVASTYMSNSKRILFLPYGPEWRQQRASMHKYININAAAAYSQSQLNEARKTIVDILDRPELFSQHFKRYTSSVVLTFTYGLRAATGQERSILELDRIAERFLTSIGLGVYPVEVMPWLDHLPDFMSSWRVMSKKLYLDTIKLYSGLAKDVRRKIKEGTAEQCLCQELWDEQKQNGLDDDSIAMLSGGMLEAGTDTTANELRAAVAAFSTHPEVVKRAQQELQDVLGNDPPSLEDIDKLEYVRCIVKEVLRWRTVAPNATIHRTIAEERIGNFILPAGTNIIYNVWSVNMSPDLYVDPEKFDPSRYLGKPGEREMTAGHDSFGRGRRICPGLHLATRSMFLVISRLLYTFDFGLAKDDITGQFIPIDLDATDLSGVMLPFKCSIQPRSPERAQFARAEWAGVSDSVGTDNID